MAELILRLRDREVNRVPILTTRLTVGRDASCDLVIDNAGVSRTHAIVTFNDDKYSVEDAESQNGISVNGRPVKSAVLAYGDRISIGKFDIELVRSQDFPVRAGGAVPTPAPRSVMRTVEMDGAALARIRDEVTAKLAAQKANQGAGAGTRPSGRPAPARANSQPAPARAGSDTFAVLKLAVLVLLAVGAVVGAVLFLLSKR